LLLEFAPELGLQDVPDPYYGNLAGFERVLALCETGVQGLIKAQTQAL
jgi:protein-tyrosine phosphatase